MPGHHMLGLTSSLNKTKITSTACPFVYLDQVYQGGAIAIQAMHQGKFYGSQIYPFCTEVQPG